MDSRLLAFVGVSLLVAMTPGPDMALVTKNALLLGRRGAVLTTLGVVSALLVHTTAAALGLAVLIRTAATLFTVVKLCGAAYLVYLGVQALRPHRRHEEHVAAALGFGRPRRRSDRVAYRQGLLSALLNPKLLVFLATLLPQFAGRDAALPGMLLLGAAFALIGLGRLIAYSLLVSRLHELFASARVRRRMEQLTGVVLIGLAARLALDRS